MLADASISRADVSKAKPPRLGRPSGTRTSADGCKGGPGTEASAAAAARHTGCRRPQPRRRAGVRSQPKRGGTAGVACRGGPPFSLGSCYDPRLNATFFSRLVIRTVTKGAFARDALKANFRPFVTVGVTTRDKRGSFSLGW
jgi:hypothetical protein